MSVYCSQCGYPMRLVEIIPEPGRAVPLESFGSAGPWFFAGASFECTQCPQQAHVRKDGSGTMTLATLHPKPQTAHDHHSYVDYWQSEKLMFLGMQCAAHYIGRDEYDSRAREIAEQVEQYKAEHPLPEGLWQRFRARVR